MPWSAIEFLDPYGCVNCGATSFLKHRIHANLFLLFLLHPLFDDFVLLLFCEPNALLGAARQGAHIHVRRVSACAGPPNTQTFVPASTRTL